MEEQELSRRELEILALADLPTRQIADRLDIGAGTVRNYLSSAYQKLGVQNRREAVRKAIELGLLSSNGKIAAPNLTKRRARPPIANTQVEEEHWLEIIRQEVNIVRDFLRGRAGRPSDERLCDLVQLCYTLELYREGRDLFALIDAAAVNPPWLYERAKKLARICGLKADV